MRAHSDDRCPRLMKNRQIKTVEALCQSRSVILAWMCGDYWPDGALVPSTL